MRGFRVPQSGYRIRGLNMRRESRQCRPHRVWSTLAILPIGAMMVGTLSDVPKVPFEPQIRKKRFSLQFLYETKVEKVPN